MKGDKEMNREEAIKRVWKMAAEIAHTGDFKNQIEMERLADEYEISVIEDDEYIAVEDDIAYFTF